MTEDVENRLLTAQFPLVRVQRGGASFRAQKETLSFGFNLIPAKRNHSTIYTFLKSGLL